MTIAYCTSDDLEDRLSEAGVTLRTDDSPPTSYGNAILRASSKINQFLLRQYTEANLAASDIVTDYASTIATYYLCTRRGNPAPDSVIAEYREAIEELKLIHAGGMDVSDIGRRKSSAPVMDNNRVRLRPDPHAVVMRSRSTTTGGRPEGFVQHNDRIEPEQSLSDPTS
jgi:phage gp36-like protein